MQRKTLLKRKFLTRGTDALLITDLTNVRYISGFTGSSGFLIISRKQDMFVTDFRYQEQAKQQVKGFKIVIERGERAKEIRELADGSGIRKLGFEDHHMTHRFYKKLLRKKLKLKPCVDAVESLRIIKSEEEIAFIKKAVHRAEMAFRKLRPHIKPGVTEKALALRLEELLKKEGCSRLPFEVIVAAGPTAALPHAKPTNKALKKGDLVIFDWGGEYNGYFSDMTRTVLLKGKDISRQREIYGTVLEAQKRAIRSVRPDIKASAVDAAARDFINGEGHEEHFGHGTGHGVGLLVHEKPSVSWRSKDQISENMVFTIEPGIYIPGFGGVRIEDMVVVTKDGATVLTILPKTLT